MKSILKNLSILFICCFLTGSLSFFVLRYIYINKAEQKAQQVHEKTLDKVTINNFEDAYLKELTYLIFSSFEAKEPSSVTMLRLRPYLTSRFLPSFIRWPNGVIETNAQSGLCDNASRMLAFVLNQLGYETDQWNMVSNSGGHSALRVKKQSGEYAFLDPFYGVVAQSRGKLISLNEAQNLVKATEDNLKVIKPLSNESKIKFYENLVSMHMAAEGEDLVLEFSIPKISDEVLVIGDLNQNARDVISGGNKYNISGYWHYIGHKYNREWVRVLKARTDTKIIMTLIDEHVDKSVIASTPLPEIQGNQLTWIIKAGETLTIKDGDADISLKRLNSFQEIDQIKFYPL